VNLFFNLTDGKWSQYGVKDGRSLPASSSKKGASEILVNFKSFKQLSFPRRRDVTYILPFTV